MIAEYETNSLEAEVAAGEDTTGAMQHELDKKAEEDETTGLRASIEKLVNILNPANLVALVLHAAAALVVGIIQIIILGLGVVIVKILVIDRVISFITKTGILKIPLLVWKEIL